MSASETRHALPQVARFLLIGGGAAFVTWLVRFPLSHIMPFAAAVTLANIIGMTLGFIGYRRFVFPDSNRVVTHQLRDFLIVNLLSTFVVVGVALAFADYILPMIGIDWQAEAISHAIGIAAGAVSNYFGHKQFSFARH